MDTALSFASNRLFSTFRTVEQGGREYLVVNGVPLVEGILNGRFVSADEFGSFVNDWNDVPVVLRHPKQNGGSARVPATDVPVVGRFYNANLDGTRLTGEYWLDKQMLESDPDGLKLIDLIAGQHPIETSSAYWSETVPQVGKFNGRDYGKVDHNIHPDHIALLPDEVGACSLKDGCGLNRNCQNCEHDTSWESSQHLRAQHLGPGPHPDGSSQDVHGSKGGGRPSEAGGSRSGASSDSVSTARSLTKKADLATKHAMESRNPKDHAHARDAHTKAAEANFQAYYEIKRDNPDAADGFYRAVFDHERTAEIHNKHADKLQHNVTGSLPAEGKKIWESVYEKSKEKYGEERAAKIAWSAVKKAGWEKDKDGVWHLSKNTSTPASLLDLAAVLLFAEAIDSK